MCVIFHQPPGEANLTQELAKKAFEANPDGAGFAFINPERGWIKARKYSTFEKFWEGYEKDYTKYGEDQDFMVHFRIATQGAVTKQNIHPFRVNKYTFMAHNGIIHDMPPSIEESDTKLFVDLVVKNLPNTWLDSPYMRKMVEEYGGWSKLMFLTNDPELQKSVYLINESSGSWWKGMWLSNKTGLGITPPIKVNRKLTWNANDKKGSEERWALPGDGVGIYKEQTPMSVSAALEVYDEQFYPGGIARYNTGPKPGDSMTEAREGRKQLGLDPLALIWDNTELLCMTCECKTTNSGNCFCWSFMCKQCEFLLPRCECKDFPSNLVMIDLTLDTLDVLEAMETRYGTTTKEVYSALSIEERTKLIPGLICELDETEDKVLSAIYEGIAEELGVDLFELLDG